MASQTIEVTNLPKEENNKDVQNKGAPDKKAGSGDPISTYWLRKEKKGRKNKRK